MKLFYGTKIRNARLIQKVLARKKSGIANENQKWIKATTHWMSRSTFLGGGECYTSQTSEGTFFWAGKICFYLGEP